MRKAFFFLLAGLLILPACNNHPAVKLPKVSHIVVLIFENHSYRQMMDPVNAPNLYKLANGEQSVLFTQSYAVAHPSEPNYLALYCGSTCGITDDHVPTDTPFTRPNLGRQLIDSGYTFAIYS